MELLKERCEKVYRYDVSCSKKEEDALCKLAIEKFAIDIPAQLEYAVQYILMEEIEKLKSKKELPILMKKLKRRNKNGNKDSNRQ